LQQVFCSSWVSDSNYHTWIREKTLEFSMVLPILSPYCNRYYYYCYHDHFSIISIMWTYLARCRNSHCARPVVVHVRHPVRNLLDVVDLETGGVGNNNVMSRRHGALSHVLADEEEILPGKQHTSFHLPRHIHVQSKTRQALTSAETAPRGGGLKNQKMNFRTFQDLHKLQV